MNEQTHAILARLTAAEARLAALESGGGGGCCSNTSSHRRRAVPVGDPARLTLTEGISLCAQLMEVPAAQEGDSPNRLIKSWLEGDHGSVLGDYTCTCTCNDGSSTSATCSNGTNVSCDCTSCDLSCD